MRTIFLLVVLAQADGPEDVVRKLYEQVVTHKPLGIPSAAQQKVIDPLLSTRLTTQLKEARRVRTTTVDNTPATTVSQGSVDDVLIFDGDAGPVVFQLSRAFAGCDGPRWVGREKRN